MDIFGVKYFRTVAHAQAAMFLKKQVFLIFFILRNNHFLTKVITFSTRKTYCSHYDPEKKTRRSYQLPHENHGEEYLEKSLSIQ